MKPIKINNNLLIKGNNYKQKITIIMGKLTVRINVKTRIFWK